jgi:UDP-N-acetyl-D-mannosaminuronic acid transferase (WecB/TagA/CpsF family)
MLAGFGVLSGRRPLAPKWIQRSGFEWLYRIVSEPRRLWPRYSRVVAWFLYLVARDWIPTSGRQLTASVKVSTGTDAR